MGNLIMSPDEAQDLFKHPVFGFFTGSDFPFHQKPVKSRQGFGLG
jgi:hypothetical protein